VFSYVKIAPTSIQRRHFPRWLFVLPLQSTRFSAQSENATAEHEVHHVAGIVHCHRGSCLELQPSPLTPRLLLNPYELFGIWFCPNAKCVRIWFSALPHIRTSCFIGVEPSAHRRGVLPCGVALDFSSIRALYAYNLGALELPRRARRGPGETHFVFVRLETIPAFVLYDF